MTQTRSFWLGWSLWALCVALTIVTGVAAGRGLDGWLPSLATLGMPTIGALIVQRRPGNAIGWLYCALGIVWALSFLPDAYRDDAQLPNHVPGWEWVVWAGTWSWMPAILGTLTFPFLLFPDGRLLSARWKPIAWLVGMTIVVLVIRAAFVSETIRDDPPLANPARIDAVARVMSILEWPFAIAMVVVFPVLLLAPVVSLTLRLRRARGVERQQIKWFAYVALLVIAGTAGVGILSEVIAVLTGTESAWAETVVWGFAPGLAILGLPLAIGFAILRHRLYDVDRLINRTLVYGLLSASLAAIYILAVVSLGGVAQLVSGQGSDLVTAASTLAVAGLVRPLRSRFQSIVDRRFYRRRYDAAQTLASFSERLRNVTALDTLSVELEAVIQETMQPSHVSLWLRAS